MFRPSLKLRNLAIALSLNGRFPVAQKILRRIFKGAKGSVRIDDFDGDLTLKLRLSEHMQSRIFWAGYYSQEIVILINKIIKEGMIFVDIGANIGEITMIAAKRVGHSGHVLSFEPVSRNLSELHRNIRRNSLHNVAIIPKGLSDHEGTTNIYDSCGQGTEGEEHLGLSSIYAGTGNGMSIESIQLTTLDIFLRENPQQRIDFVKIDIEGAELPCLKGARQTIQRFKPHLIIEVQKFSSAAGGYEQTDILNFLSSLGYKFSKINRGGKLSAIEANDLTDYQNILCVHSSSVENIH